MNQTIDNTRGYNGNILLKRANQNIEWTPDLVQEWVKCSEDPLYFIQNYMKIITLNEGLKLFKPWPYQENMIKSFVDNRYSIVTTARQAGKCQKLNTPIKVRNKKTGEIIETTIGEFHERVKEAK
jgi:hypothetical protein